MRWWDMQKGREINCEMISSLRFWFCTIDESLLGKFWLWLVTFICSASLHHLQGFWTIFLMKLYNSYRDRCCLIDRFWTAAVVVVLYGHRLRHRLARNLLARLRKLALSEAHNWNHRSRWSWTSTLSRCFEWFRCRHRHHDGRRQLWA